MVTRRIEFTIRGGEDRMPYHVEPAAPQDAGVAGDHLVTEAVFHVPSALVKADYRYRFEFVDGMNQYDTTDTFTLTPAGSAAVPATVAIPAAWTYVGGSGVLRLVITQVSGDFREPYRMYSFSARLRFARRGTGEGNDERQYERGLSGLIEEVKASASSADRNAQTASEAAATANAAAGAVNTAIQSANAAGQAATQQAAFAQQQGNYAQTSGQAAQTAAGQATAAAGQATTAAGEAQTQATAAKNAAADAKREATAAQTAGGQAREDAQAASEAATRANNSAAATYIATQGAIEATDQAHKAVEDMANTFGSTVVVEAAGSLVSLDDVSPEGTLRRVAVRGATTQTGTPSPAAPVSVKGVAANWVTMTGKNFVPYALNKNDLNGAWSSASGVDRFTYGNNAATAGDPLYIFAGPNQAGTGVNLTGLEITVSLEIRASRTLDGNVTVNMTSPTYQTPTGTAFFPLTNSWQAVSIRGIGTYSDTWGGMICRASVRLSTTLPVSGDWVEIRRVQVERGKAATDYIPYTIFAQSLPAVSPLHGDGTVVDTFDVVSGVDTRNWTKIVLNGTETWSAGGTAVGGKQLFRLEGAAKAKSPASNDDRGQVVSTHYPSETATRTWYNVTGVAVETGTGKLQFYDADRTALDAWKAWLVAQAAAGTPVTVVYRLATPTNTQYMAKAFKPPSPNATVFADAGSVEVKYNADTKMYIDNKFAALNK